jgi:hypothetical protein
VLMVIIGAGASYDSSPDKLPDTSAVLYRPPLANNLFAEEGVMGQTRSAFPQINPLIPELNPRVGRSIEEALQRLDAEAAGNPRRPPQLAAVRYYLQELFRSLQPKWLGEIGQVTNYHGLLERIQHYRADESVLLVTFNYDTLIEQALTEMFGGQFEVMADYISRPDFKLFKLHGSANWGRCLHMAPRGSSIRENSNPWALPTQMIEQAATLSITDTFMVTGGRMPFPKGPPLFPAIAIPVRDKQRFECPADQIGELQRLIPQVNRLLTIGWRGSELHFMKFLQTGLTHRQVSVTTVAGTLTEAGEVMSQIRKVVAVSNTASFAGFSQALGDRSFDPLLAHHSWGDSK